MRILLLFFFSFIIMLAACEGSHQPQSHNSPRDEIDDRKSNTHSPKEVKEGRGILPLVENEESFYSVIDWLDHETFLYVNNQPSGSTVLKYNILSGEKEPIIETDQPIVTIDVNQRRDLFLLHTSPSPYEAKIQIIDEQKNILFDQIFPSSEIEYSWNQENEDLLIVTSFYEDWTFETFLVNIKNQSIEKNPIQHPFLKWLSHNEQLFLKWSEDEPGLSAPLYSYHLESAQENFMFGQIIEFEKLSDQYLLTVQLLDKPTGVGKFQFRDPTNGEILFSLENQLFSSYSGWILPYFTMNPSQNLFYTFAKSDTESLDLIEVNLKDGEKKTIIKNVKNKPILLSPNGEYMLYGNRYDKIIILDDQKIIPIVEVGKVM